MPNNPANSGLGPPSVLKPGGMWPPVGSPWTLAARTPAWSAPVWPPEMTCSSGMRASRLGKDGNGSGIRQPWPGLVLETVARDSTSVKD